MDDEGFDVEAFGEEGDPEDENSEDDEFGDNFGEAEEEQF